MSDDPGAKAAAYSRAKLLVCSPSYSIGTLAGAMVSLVKDRRVPVRCELAGTPWAFAGGANYLAAELGFLAKATSAAFMEKVLAPWLIVSLVADGFARQPFGVMRQGYRDARLG